MGKYFVGSNQKVSRIDATKTPSSDTKQWTFYEILKFSFRVDFMELYVIIILFKYFFPLEYLHFLLFICYE